MKEVKNKDKNRRSCCERYVTNYILGNITAKIFVNKMKVNPQLTPLVEKILSDQKAELINIPSEMWNADCLDGCVSQILEMNVRYAHIAKYLNAISKGRIRFMLYRDVKEYGGKPVSFAFEDGTVCANFTDDGITVKSVNDKVVDFVIQ